MLKRCGFACGIAAMLGGAMAVGQIVPPYPVACVATGTREVFRGAIYRGKNTPPPYTVSYRANVSWDCTLGVTPACQVCGRETLSMLSSGGLWVVQKSLEGSSTAPCASTANARTWAGIFGNLQPRRTYRLRFAYKEAAPLSPCDDAEGWVTIPYVFKFNTR